MVGARRWIRNRHRALAATTREHHAPLHHAFEREQIEFAYPTQKLWLAQTAAPARVER
jgi:hypothetical protein